MPKYSQLHLNNDRNVDGEDIELEILTDHGQGRLNSPAPLWLSKRACLYRSLGYSFALLIVILCFKAIVASESSTNHQNLGSNNSCKPLPKPPQAMRIPYRRQMHGDVQVDDFNWMSNSSFVNQLNEYVDAENNYTQVYMRPLTALRRNIETELKKYNQFIFRRFWPLPRHIYEYNTSYILRYPRSSIDSWLLADIYPSGAVELLVDFEQFKLKQLSLSSTMQKTSSYFTVGAVEVSNDEQFAAFTIDTVGDEHFTLYVMNITDKSIIANFSDVYYHVRWWNGSNLFWSALDQSDVPRYLFHASSADRFTSQKLMYTEQDETMTVEVETSADLKYFFLRIIGQVASEVWTFDQLGLLQVILPREKNVFYDICHRDGFFYMRTNRNSADFEVYRFPVGDSSKLELIVSEQGIFIEKVEMFQQYFVLWCRNSGLRITRIHTYEEPHIINNELEFGALNSVYSIFPGTATDMYDRRYRLYEYPALIFTNISYLQTPSTYEYVFETREIRLLFNSLNPIDPSKYSEIGLYVQSYDGEKIPVSLISNKTLSPDSPVLVFGYGAYGSITEANFIPEYFPLINRGISIAVVHPRGDLDMGSHWYTDGKLKTKINTFLDFKSSLTYLKKKFNSKIAVFGRSAGGLVSGTSAVFLGTNKRFGGPVKSPRGSYDNIQMQQQVSLFVNESDPRNSLVDAVILQVPFVDVVNDLLDPNVPWTPFEWNEWGNPYDEQMYKLMMDYSPYDNVNMKYYPSVMVMSGLQDTRVKYQEPAKFAAKLRSKQLNELSGTVCDSYLHSNAESKPLLLHIGSGGHFGLTGDELSKEKSMWISFLLQNLMTNNDVTDETIQKK